MSPRPKRFLGKSEHPVDPKGRMSLSKQFHGALDRDDEGRPTGVLCVERSAGKCLWIFNDEGFAKEAERFGTDAMPDPAEDAATDLDEQRDFFEFVEEFTLDAAGRVVIPARFRELAGIGKRATCVGVFGRLEVWSTERWEARQRGKNSPLVAGEGAPRASSGEETTS